MEKLLLWIRNYFISLLKNIICKLNRRSFDLLFLFY
nr:MAG TPA: hypothetical protein [Caudoviricetes sp.]